MTDSTQTNVPLIRIDDFDPDIFARLEQIAKRHGVCASASRRGGDLVRWAATQFVLSVDDSVPAAAPVAHS